MVGIICCICDIAFEVHPYRSETAKCCSRRCSNILGQRSRIGRKLSEETKRKIGEKHIGKKLSPEHIAKLSTAHLGQKAWNKGISLSDATKKKLSAALRGRAVWNKGLIGIGGGSYTSFKKGHTPWNKGKYLNGIKSSKIRERNSQAYNEWRNTIRDRDGWKCRIDNHECQGRIEVHHIDGWRDHPELRYDINNGITLCIKHHPRKREEERRLADSFTTIINNLK